MKIDGESVVKEKTYTLAELKSKFKQYTYQLTIECGGNGRSEFNPPAQGNQWTIGAVHCASWTGVRLRDVLEDAKMGRRYIPGSWINNISPNAMIQGVNDNNTEIFRTVSFGIKKLLNLSNIYNASING